MDDVWRLIGMVVWTAWALAAIASALQMRRLMRRFRWGRRDEFQVYRPPATVIVPIKGKDDDLPACVGNLCGQDYPRYRLVFVVESADDPGYDVVRTELGRYPQTRAEVLIAGHAGPDEGQKIHNQLYVLEQLDAGASDDEVWVFADSDAVPSSNWLADMVGPLASDQKYGVTTGYRWLVPGGGAAGGGRGGAAGSLWTHLASVINSSVACMYRRPAFEQAWGGAMAMRVATARRGDLRGRLRGALTDDYQVTVMCRDLGLRVWFAARCLVATPVEFTFSSLANFARRQYLITRIYAPRLYLVAVVVLSLWVAGFVSAWVYLLTAIIRQQYDGPPIVAAAAIVTVLAANQLRASWRRRIIVTAFGEPMLERLKVTLRYDRWATPLWMTLHWLLALSALWGRRLRWRGIEYRLMGRQHVVRVSRP